MAREAVEQIAVVQRRGVFGVGGDNLIAALDPLLQVCQGHLPQAVIPTHSLIGQGLLRTTHTAQTEGQQQGQCSRPAGPRLASRFRIRSAHRG